MKIKHLDIFKKELGVCCSELSNFRPVSVILVSGEMFDEAVM